jgi:hypothetical protein
MQQEGLPAIGHGTPGGPPGLNPPIEVESATWSAGGTPVLKAGATGLTLPAANHVVHLDRWWKTREDPFLALVGPRSRGVAQTVAGATRRRIRSPAGINLIWAAGDRRCTCARWPKGQPTCRGPQPLLATTASLTSTASGAAGRARSGAAPIASPAGLLGGEELISRLRRAHTCFCHPRNHAEGVACVA